MYSWYFPKSQSSPGIGQRHDWQNILLWLAYPAEDAVVLAVNVQVHDKYTYKDVKKVSWHFTQPLLQYKSGASWFQGPVLGLTDSWTAETQPMIAWENLTDAARWALNLTDWGAATAAFTDVHLSRWLDTANWYSGTPS